MFTEEELISSFILGLIGLVCLRLYMRSQGANTQSSLQSAEFVKFQRNYLGVLFLAFLGDWLQGPYLYSLYVSHGYSESELATLFATGYLSSLLFGTFIASLADKFGRRKMCQVFGLAYAACSCLCLIPNFYILLFGRLFGGISTSLLFSVFEAWMVCEHQKRKSFRASTSHALS